MVQPQNRWGCTFLAPRKYIVKETVNYRKPNSWMFFRQNKGFAVFSNSKRGQNLSAPTSVLKINYLWQLKCECDRRPILKTEKRALLRCMDNDHESFHFSVLCVLILLKWSYDKGKQIGKFFVKIIFVQGYSIFDKYIASTYIYKYI